MKTLKLLILFLLSSLTTVFSQGLNFININTDMGLPSNECYRIVQDKRGYIWISTDAGLVRYNSKEFVLFNKAKGMPSTNDIYALSMDKQGRVWFATGRWKVGYVQNDKVHVLDWLVFERETNGDVIYKIQFLESSNSLLVCSRYNSYEVSLTNEIATVNTIRGGLDYCDFFFVRSGEEKYIATQYNKKPFSKGNYYSLALGNSEQLDFAINVKRDFVKDCFTSTFKNGDIAFNINRRLFILDKNNKIRKSYVLKTKIQSLCVDGHNNLWLGCTDGIFLLENGNTKNIPTQIMNDISISGIIEDFEGGLWFTSLENGIFFCSNSLVKTITSPFTPKKAIHFSKVVNNLLWFNNNDGFLTVIGNDTIRFSKLGEEKNPYVTDLAFIGNRYLATTTLGIYSIDKSFKKIRHLLFNNNPVAAFGLIKKQDNSLFAFNNNSFLGIGKDSLKNSYMLKDLRVKDAVYLNDNEIIVAANSGIYKYIKKSNSPYLERIQTAVYGHDINKIFLDSRRNIWLPSSFDTLYVLDTTFNLRAAIPLPFKNIECREVTEIPKDCFWVSTNLGVLNIRFQKGLFSHYEISLFDKSSGLISSDVYNVIEFRNKFFIATGKGLCYIDKIEHLKYTSQPQTNINALTVNNSNVSLSTPKFFSHAQNNISFQVDALAFKKITQRGAFYKYRLDGLENEFKTATGIVVSYNNLPPGTYTFIAKTFYDVNTEDTTPSTFSFTIKPAFWQTWWGALLMVFASIGFVFLFIQWRISKIKLIEKEKAAINQTIAEYRFTALKAQMDPHFVFNSINVIQNLILEKDKTEAYNSLGKFSRLIRMILNQSDSVFATIEEELALINLYVELNQLRVDYPFSFVPEIQQGLMSCSVPSLIVQPFIENALWHGILPLKGKKNGLILMKVFKADNNVLVIQVKDNGIGRKASSLNKSSLLHISKGTELIRERLKAYQAMNDNCLAELNIFDLEENGEPSGTMVEIKIATLDDET